MKHRFLPFAAAVCGMAFLSACISSSFTVPKIGTRFEDHKKYLVYDSSLNMYIIPIEKYKTLEYEHFDVVLPQDSTLKFYAPASSNSSNHAELYLRNLPPETSFFGRAMYTRVMEKVNSLEELEKFYQAKYTPDKLTIGLDTKITKHNGFPVVEYDILARLPETGKVISVHGFCMFDPENPGYMFDFGAGRTAYEKNIDNDILIRASGEFLESVRFRK